MVSSLKLVSHIIVGIVLIFALTSAITTLFSSKLSSELLGSYIGEIETTEIYKYFLSSENHYFVESNSEPRKFSISKMALQLATSIKIDDHRTLLGNELPGMVTYHTRIHIAGEGTDYTNLPVESPAPMDTILKEREIVEEMLTDGDPNESTDPPPARTTNGKKVVYLYHSHSWESFLPVLKDVTKPNEATSTNPKANIVAVGDMLKNKLVAKGIGVEHNNSNIAQLLNDRGWNYNHSYQFSREYVQQTMATNNDLVYFIDIHRDALRKDKTTISIDGKSYARLFFIVGKEHKDYKENLALAEQLHNELQKKYPGLSRGVLPKSKAEGNGIYNQDLSNGALLIEFGGVDNTMEELNHTVDAFGEVFSEYFWNSKGAEGY